MLGILIAVTAVTALVFVWKYLNNINKFFEEKGIPCAKPLPFFGNSWQLIARQKSMVEIHRNLYSMFPDVKLYGFYDFMRPSIIVRDIELVERVLIKDFQHFTDRGFGITDEETNPLDVNLFSMSGKKWKAVRNKFSPIFTTGKLRGMVPQIKDIGDLLVQRLEKNEEKIELKDALQRFAMDVIASCAFGININTITKDESEFQKMAITAFKFTFRQLARFLAHQSFPKLAKSLKIRQNDPRTTKYFCDLLRETIQFRKRTNQTRPDFVQLMLTLQQKGSVEFEGEDKEDDYLKSDLSNDDTKTKENYELTDEAMVGHSFIFLVAGFDAAATTMMYMAYEFSLNPDIQAKAAEEVAQVVKQRNGVLNYDTARDMQYLTMCLYETLRLHTFVPMLFRQCTKTYTFPGTSLTVEPGQRLFVPIAGIHKDPEYYPEPDQFKPERFAPDVVRPNCTFLPFGDGPRICIAMRFVLMEIKLCMAQILLKYSISLDPSTKLPLEMDPKNFVDMPLHPLYFKLTKRDEVPAA
ncbi:cytochrome P450 [Nesidiocoris tenuis]|uniref:Cytochrome P450 n=1 Tax=Nesidiocoris tenuis TaxID=355587 RepID=A0ABN7B687_9HEMI|nr:cytochrome P450 [Nesidiocoris tenuis]